MRKIARIVAAIGVGLVAGAGAITASTQTTLEKVKQAGFVRVGFPNQVPYAYANEKGQLTGADAVIAKMVTQKMGIAEMDGVLTEFASLIPGLQAGRFDIVLAMFVNPTRCKQVAFSEPIYKIGQGIVVKAGNPKSIKSYDDLVKRDDVKVAVMAGAVQARYLKTLGASDSAVASFPDGPSAVAAVSTGRADAFAISSLSAKRMVETASESAGLEVVMVSPDPMIDGKPAAGYDAFAFRQTDTELQAAFNAALEEIKATPEFLKAMQPFGFSETNLPDQKTADLCK
jgi:polar amino acid transport system substrate-binding protein